jgi:hypothetical protein
VSPQYLDDNGNPVAAPAAAGPKAYLDDNGNPVSSAPPAPKASFSAEPAPYSPAGLKEKAYKARDYVVNALPSIGGTVGGVLGAGAGEGVGSVPMAVAGSAAGGVLGETARQKLNERFHPEEKVMSREDATKEIGKQAVEQGLSELAGAGIGKAIGPTLKGAVSKLYFAGNLGPREDLELVMPEIMEAEKKQPAQTVGDFIDVVGSAKKKIATEVDTSMMSPVTVAGVKNKVPLAGAPADTTPIANRILQLTTNHPSEAVTDPAKIARIRQRVVQNYSQPRSYGWLNDRRTVLNRELNKYYALKTPADKAQYLFQHPDFEIDKAEADSIRDIVYPSMDRAAGKPPGYFEGLQRKRGALMSIEDQAQDHIQNLKMKSKIAKGAPTRDPLSGSPLAPGKVGIYTRMTRMGSKDVAKQADNQVAKAFTRTPGSKAAKAVGSKPGKEVLALPLRMFFNPDMPDPNERNSTDAWSDPQQ